MAKVVFDPIVRSLSNKLGNFVYVNRKGESFVRAYNPYKRTFNENQKSVHKSFKAVIQVWKQLPDMFKMTFARLVNGADMSEYNKFIGLNTPRQKQGSPLLLTPGTGLALPAGLIVTSKTAGQVSLEYTAPTPAVCMTLMVQTVPKGEEGVRLTVHYDLESGTHTFDECTTAGEYIVYCVATDKVFAEAEEVSESAGFKITVA